MHRLLPADRAGPRPLEELYADLELPHGDGRRAGVAVGMVASLDGATARDGVSGGLGGDADAVAFARLRTACDAIVVAAGTVRAEDYGPPGGGDERRRARRSRGLAEVPGMVVVTASAELDPAARLFTDPRRDPDVPLVVATCASAPRSRRDALADVAEVVVLGDEQVDLEALLRWCLQRGWARVLVEGGPALNAQLAARDLVDEVFVTIAPALVAGHAARLLDGSALDPPRRCVPVELHEHAGELLLRARTLRGR